MLVPTIGDGTPVAIRRELDRSVLSLFTLAKACMTYAEPDEYVVEKDGVHPIQLAADAIRTIVLLDHAAPVLLAQARRVTLDGRP